MSGTNPHAQLSGITFKTGWEPTKSDICWTRHTSTVPLALSLAGVHSVDKVEGQCYRSEFFIYSHLKMCFMSLVEAKEELGYVGLGLDGAEFNPWGSVEKWFVVYLCFPLVLLWVLYRAGPPVLSPSSLRVALPNAGK